jgi:FkbM family methyltransferase
MTTETAETPVMVSKGGRQFWVRPGTMDEYVLGECNGGGYKKHIEYADDQVWLDAGGNIGGWSCIYGPLVKQVYSVEPEPYNVAMLRANLELNHITNVDVIEAALAADPDEKPITFYVSTGSNMGSHTVIPKRGRRPLTVGTYDVGRLKRLGITHVKMDVEGAEVDLLPAMDLSDVEFVVAEYHVSVLKDKDLSKLEALKAHMRDAGFTVVQEPEDVKKRWTIMLYMTKTKEQ